MASIGLYDIDFWHGSKAVPNLELMKVFSYYYKNNDIVVFLNPKEDIERFNHIIYFKEFQSTKIPKSLPLSGDKKSIYGYGFYGKFSPLKEQFTAVPPLILPYELNYGSNKKSYSFEKIFKGSIIRLENNDFTDFDKNKKHIYLADHNIVRLDSFPNFMREYRDNYTIHTLFSFKVNSLDEADMFFKYCPHDRQLYINFDYDFYFFSKYYNEKVLFPFVPFANEKNKEIFLRRIVSMILYSKNKNSSFNLTQPAATAKEKHEAPILQLCPLIYSWNLKRDFISFEDYIDKYKPENKELIINLLNNHRRLRLLLKQNPKTFDCESIDFS